MNQATQDGDGPEVRRLSTIACPACGHAQVEPMPVDACLYFYDCRGCGMLLQAKPGDCCVFCSHGSVPCPPKQIEGTSGCSCG